MSVYAGCLENIRNVQRSVSSMSDPGKFSAWPWKRSCQLRPECTDCTLLTQSAQKLREILHTMLIALSLIDEFTCWLYNKSRWRLDRTLLFRSCDWRNWKSPINGVILFLMISMREFVHSLLYFSRFRNIGRFSIQSQLVISCFGKLKE